MSLTLIRKVAGLRMTDLAKRAGVDLSAISRLEHGGELRNLRRAEYVTVARIAAVFNLTPNELLTLVEATPVRFTPHPATPPARRGRPPKSPAAQGAAAAR